ncbi:MAG: PD-(D/E)XK nuclease family protein, partial [Patescibacteria group bacterium]
MRPFGLKLFPPEKVIESATLAHRQLYRFRHHKAKSHLIIEEDYKNRKFAPLREYLSLVPAETPHQYFQEGMRASEAPIGFSKSDMIVRAKKNYATKLASFVLQAVSRNKDRHDALQRFMLANDSVTVATEVPVYIRREDLAHMQTQLGFILFKKAARRAVKSVKDLKVMAVSELPKLITGHIDFVQIRNGFCHIMDYKPKAEKERPLEQLTLYALALSRLTGLRVYDFKCAWFDENDYFEFFPLHLVYKKTKRKRKRVETIEGRYRMNKDPGVIHEIRPEKEGPKPRDGP